ILFSRDSQCLRDLFGCMQMLNHRALVMWALDCAAIPLRQFEMKYPKEDRPRRCLEFSRKWAKGEIRMPSAKQAILGAHAAAKDIGDDAYGALCHAIGHAGATVHAQTHAIGLPLYELTAIVLRCGKEEYTRPVMDRINNYNARLLYW
ncbi:MAG: putative immunity protein, partial [Bacillota bacterium]